MKIFSHALGIVPVCVAASAAAVSLTGCTHPLTKSLDEYRAAKKRGDYAAAGRYLADDARIWFGRKEGDGAPLRARGGPYADWDKEFRSTSTRTTPRVEGRTITYESTEINDFYRLTNRTPTPALITYYFDDTGKITGMFYRGKDAKPKQPPPPDKYDEFKAWAAKRYPALLDSDEMSIPNNPKRWRALLVEWRADVGLPVIE